MNFQAIGLVSRRFFVCVREVQECIVQGGYTQVVFRFSKEESDVPSLKQSRKKFPESALQRAVERRSFPRVSSHHRLRRLFPGAQRRAEYMDIAAQL